jgi:hypothetical protein
MTAITPALPTKPPSPSAAADIREWETIVATSLSRAQASAEVWRNGLAGFITVLTGAVVVKGPESSMAMPLCWRLAVGFLLIAGVGTSIVALWTALRAASPRLETVELDLVKEKWGTVRAAQVGAALESAKRLKASKILMICALISLGAAYGLWWISPTPADPFAVVRMDDGKSVCGVLDTSGGELIVQSEDEQVKVRLSDVASIRQVEGCEG